jgi:hypothetical protein
MERVMKDRAARDAVAFLVPLPARAAPTVRVNITLPAVELAAIDAYAEANGFTRSGFILAAARRTMRNDKAAWARPLDQEAPVGIDRRVKSGEETRGPA